MGSIWAVYALFITTLFIIAVLFSFYLFIVKPKGFKSAIKVSKEKYNEFSPTIKFLLWVALFIILIGFWMPFLLTRKALISELDFTSTGAIGDTFGGILNPFVGLAAVIVTGLAFYMQYQANKIQIENFKKELSFQKKVNRKIEIDEKVNILKLVVLNNKELLESLTQTVQWAEDYKNKFRIDNNYPDKFSGLNVYALENLTLIPYDKILHSVEWIINDRNDIGIDEFVKYYNAIRGLKQVVEFFNSNMQEFLTEDRSIRKEIFGQVELLFIETEKLRQRDSKLSKTYEAILKRTLYNGGVSTEILKRKNFLLDLNKNLAEIQNINVMVFMALNRVNVYEGNLRNIIGILEKLIVGVKAEFPKIKGFDEKIKMWDLESYRVRL